MTVQPICLGCRYPLTGLAAGVCPECGKAFDPARRKTYGPRRLVGPHRVLAWQPSWSIFVGYFVLSAALIVPNASPNGYCDDLTSGVGSVWRMASWVLIALVAIVFVTARVWTLLAGTGVSARLRWLLLPLLFFGWSVTWERGWLWRARWYFAKDNFEALAKTPPSRWETGWYGTFYVTDIRPSDDGSAWLELGFPDWYGQGPAHLFYDSSTIGRIDNGGPRQEFGNGWGIHWNPT
ncbi:MAG TPA: hypothetical protein VD971_14105 [Phycisphaerales bacterium]|nr:hypothetical protein [Phycisphaerales bacterium]